MEKNITNPIEFKGEGREFFGIWIVNILLSIITLGVYSAWAKVRTKRYFYGNTHLAGDSFEYHAQPMQILKGRLVALVALFVWGVANSFSPNASILMFILFYLALPWLLWSNARFDAAMTSYRNVHFSFNSSLEDAFKVILGRGFGAFVASTLYFAAVIFVAQASVFFAVLLGFGSLIMLAIIYAWVVSGLHKYFSNGFQFGEWKFSAEIETRFFIKTYLKALVFAIGVSIVLTIGVFSTLLSGADFEAIQAGDFSSLLGDSSYGVFFISYFGFIVLTIALTAYTTTRVRNYIFSKLVAKVQQNDVEPYRFNSSMTARGYTWLVISNFLLQVFTLGIARPWVMVRTTRYIADNTAVLGDMSLLKASDQSANVKSAISDEMAQAFDVGMGIG
ncbi:YjgN family protein [Vibrio hepatarius]|uniref:YjgN family protein n=1 Tax=Vibrio hepatarius TaxID=171383 RepID=UPI001C09361A|nr:YjgN family protein [Vibrio hepatarius]MBU2897163.1 DUF898 domain-containing protein [Vibrio hepatarius]